jgi:uncharacterized protein (TIGR02246 family)
MDDERDHIVAAYRRVIEAWNQRDADRFGAAFTDDGSSVGFDGSQMNGRTEITLELRRIFASHPTAAYVAKLREVRPLGSGVVLVRAVVGMIPPGKTALNPDVNAVQSVVLVSEGGEYRIALLHNTPAAFHGRPHVSEQLTDELSEVMRSGRVVVAEET